MDAMIIELQSKVPTLFSLLKCVLKTKVSRRKERMILVVISGIIFKHR